MVYFFPSLGIKSRAQNFSFSYQLSIRCSRSVVVIDSGRKVVSCVGTIQSNGGTDLSKTDLLHSVWFSDLSIWLCWKKLRETESEAFWSIRLLDEGIRRKSFAMDISNVKVEAFFALIFFNWGLTPFNSISVHIF